jgi:hypothetical protein
MCRRYSVPGNKSRPISVIFVKIKESVLGVYSFSHQARRYRQKSRRDATITMFTMMTTRSAAPIFAIAATTFVLSCLVAAIFAPCDFSYHQVRDNVSGDIDGKDLALSTEADSTSLSVSTLVDAPTAITITNTNAATIVDIIRALQESDTATSNETGFADPVVVCTSLNTQLKNSMNCTCSRWGKRGVDVKCMGLVDTCNSDSTYCSRNSFQYMSDEKGLPLYVTSCTNLTTLGLTEPVDSCVQVIASVPGNFTTVKECYATLNEESCACTVINEKDSCATVTQDSRDATTNDSTTTAHVSIDCCRHMDGAKATCLPVIPTGPVAVIYDETTSEQMQQCKASSAPSLTNRLVGAAFKVLAATSAYTFLGLLL